MAACCVSLRARGRVRLAGWCRVLAPDPRRRSPPGGSRSCRSRGGTSRAAVGAGRRRRHLGGRPCPSSARFAPSPRSNSARSVGPDLFAPVGLAGATLLRGRSRLGGRGRGLRVACKAVVTGRRKDFAIGRRRWSLLAPCLHAGRLLPIAVDLRDSFQTRSRVC